MKIRTAIFLVYVAASAVGLAVLMRFVLAEVRPRYVTAVQLSMQGAVDTVARALEGKAADEIARVLSGETNYRVNLSTPDGLVLFDSRGEMMPEEGDTGYESRSELAKEVSMRLIDDRSVKNELEVAVAASVTMVDDKLATLEFSRSFRSVNAVIWVERKKLTAIALLVSGVMLVAGWWISAQLTRSLERLTLYVQKVRDGRKASPPTSRAREIATLGKAFEEMRDTLEGRQHADRYTQALAHEVKAPLAAIRGAAELLNEDMPLEERGKFLGNIRSESARIQQIVDRLLELSSIEARKSLQQTEELSGEELAQEAAAIVRSAYAAREVSLEVDVSEISMNGERVLLREALVNLLHNALGFSPDRGKVCLRATRDGNRVVFEVEDRGPGIPDYAVTRIFERFYSLPRPGSSRKSTGLGLALVREVAHLHGGDVSLTNRVGGGALATLWLPLRLNISPLR